MRRCGAIASRRAALVSRPRERALLDYSYDSYCACVCVRVCVRVCGGRRRGVRSRGGLRAGDTSGCLWA